jgi:beta-xylosidase
MYVTHGSNNLSVAQLTLDRLNYVKDISVYDSTAGYIEGSRMYKRNGIYYIITHQPDNAEYILKSKSGPFGPYELGTVLNNTKPPSVFAGVDTPHQGAFVDTLEGDWWYMAFVDVNGDVTARAPVLSSLAWDENYWPVLKLDANNTWPESLPYPVLSGARTPNSDASLTGVDNFASGILSEQYQWNHNPNTSQYSVSRNGVLLKTATMTNDIYQAQNTLTRRKLCPSSSATILLDFAGMHTGDRAGLSIFRDSSAWTGIAQNGSSRYLVQRTGMTTNSTDDWATISIGEDGVTKKLGKKQTKIYLRVTGDFSQPDTKGISFSYSMNGQSFTPFGENFQMDTGWEFFQAYGFAVFNYATNAIGGSVLLKEFALEFAHPD